MEQSLRPKSRPKSKTKRLTVRGRPVWIDHDGSITDEKNSAYSEVTTTVPWGTGWATLPTVDGQGDILSDEEVFKRVVEVKNKLSKSGPVDFITGEELPVFDDREEAVKYAIWRSKTMFNEDANSKGYQSEQQEMEPEEEEGNSFLYDMGSITKGIAKGLLGIGLNKIGVDYYPTQDGFNKGGTVDKQMKKLFAGSK